MALQRNPTLVQAGAQVQISRGKAIQAGLYPNPELGYVSEQIGADGNAGELQGLFVEQQIVTAAKLDLSRAKFAQEVRQGELQALAQQYRVVQGVRVAYYDTLVHQRRLDVQRQLFQMAQEVTTTVRELVNVGQANRADLLQAEVELQRAKAKREAAQRRLNGAWEELSAVIGMPQLATTSLADELDIAQRDRIDRDAALANILACAPQLRFARAEVRRDQIALQRERVEPIPNLNVRAEAGYNFEAPDTVAGVEIGVRLPLFDKNQGTILQAQAELMRAQAEVERIELMLRKRFAETFADYEASLVLADTYGSEALPKAAEIYQLYFESFQNRRAAWPQVLDAQRDYYDLYEEYLENLLDARRAQVQIDTFLVDDGLRQPPEPTPEGHRETTPKPR
jgi:cobalt-zinc-cadmium efflux system outer membrane protein